MIINTVNGVLRITGMFISHALIVLGLKRPKWGCVPCSCDLKGITVPCIFIANFKYFLVATYSSWVRVTAVLSNQQRKTAECSFSVLFLGLSTEHPAKLAPVETFSLWNEHSKTLKKKKETPFFLFPLHISHFPSCHRSRHQPVTKKQQQLSNGSQRSLFFSPHKVIGRSPPLCVSARAKQRFEANFNQSVSLLHS